MHWTSSNLEMTIWQLKTRQRRNALQQQCAALDITHFCFFTCLHKHKQYTCSYQCYLVSRNIGKITKIRGKIRENWENQGKIKIHPENSVFQFFNIKHLSLYHSTFSFALITDRYQDFRVNAKMFIQEHTLIGRLVKLELPPQIVTRIDLLVLWYNDVLIPMSSTYLFFCTIFLFFAICVICGFCWDFNEFQLVLLSWQVVLDARQLDIEIDCALINTCYIFIKSICNINIKEIIIDSNVSKWIIDNLKLWGMIFFPSTQIIVLFVIIFYLHLSK